MAKKHDEMLVRIEAFIRARGGRVRVERASRGYSLFRESDGRPHVRLRPTGQGDSVEILWWSSRDRWDPIGDFGPLVMPLDEALEYIASNRSGYFS